MKPTEAQIAERLPVWEALSDFFLDTELQPDDYERIASKLVSSNYTVDQIEDILVSEVCPVLRWNMLAIAGEWAGFHRDLLKEKIGPRYGKHLKFKGLFVFRHRWIYGRHWRKVRARIQDMRNNLEFAVNAV